MGPAGYHGTGLLEVGWLGLIPAQRLQDAIRVRASGFPCCPLAPSAARFSGLGLSWLGRGAGGRHPPVVTGKGHRLLPVQVMPMQKDKMSPEHFLLIFPRVGAAGPLCPLRG